MTIVYNDIVFNVVDNGDGTFTLDPAALATAAELLVEYRAARDEVKRKVEYKQKIQDKLAEVNGELVTLRAQRDDLKLLLAANDPDGDETQ